MAQVEMYFLWFLIYSILGWIYESALCSIMSRHLVNRGFLNGPYCPIYGFGAVFDIIALGSIENPVLLFFCGMLISSILEYFTSWSMEKLFHARWWDYSDHKFNINGRVCLLGAVFFGLASVGLIDFIHPAVRSLTDMLDAQELAIITFVAFAIFFADCIYTTAKFVEFDKILNELSGHLDSAMQSFKSLYEKAGEGHHDQAHGVKVHSVNSQVRRMLDAFPQMTSVRYSDGLKKLRALLKSEKDDLDTRHKRK